LFERYKNEWSVQMFLFDYQDKNSLTRNDVARMNEGAIVFVTSNPDPEMRHEEAVA